MATVPAGESDRTARITPVVSSASSGRRRRPSGEPPPLPRRIERRTSASVLLVGATVALAAAMSARPVLRAVTAVDLAILRGLARLRSGPATDVMDGVAALGSESVVRGVAWATLAVLLVARRWRHLVVYLVVTLATTLLVTAISLSLGRPRPAGVPILGSWDGYAFPSRPVAALALVLVAALFTVAPPGPPRTRAAVVAVGLVGLLGLARLYLAVDHPSDVVAAVVLGALLPLTFFRLLTPDDVFPVAYRRRPTGAHLELSPARHDAIVRAMDQQLGLTVESVELFGLAGSAGSTPMRLGVLAADGGHRVLFGKLYAVTHLRSDRWYKFMRTVLYGRLEDEKPFSTVRRLVEYEDHMLRLLRDAGLPTPAPQGFVEITPEREYLVVMEFLADSHELGAAPVGDREIDSGLRIVRKLWEAGVAHRDLKPSNLLVRDGEVLLIDVAFATVRPTPWRQAVDLANMMLTLALCSTADEVYRRALRQFAADDIAEAFAATRSVTLPTQLRTRLRDDPRDLVAEFRRLAPPRQPVSIQLWSVRRVAVTAAVVLAVVLATGLVVAYAQLVGLA
jgi:tRNA A-37 threonylcarbamoyl transferase component Bud32/membrane-associated phospholipid phosphatase